MRKIIFILIFVFSLSAQSADRWFNNADGSGRLWKFPNNWVGGVEPILRDNAKVGVDGGVDDTHIPLIDATHTGDEAALCNNLFIGTNRDGNFEVQMTGGELSVADQLVAGTNALSNMTGKLTHSAGYINTTYLKIGAKTKGTYNISGTALIDVSKHIWVGADSFPDTNGIVNQTGGEVNCTGILILPNWYKGTYNISDGTLNVNTAGSWNQSLWGGYQDGSKGKLNISGDAEVNLNKTAWIGHQGDFELNISGGTLNVNGKVLVPTNSGGQGKINIEGGTMNCNYTSDPLQVYSGLGSINLEGDGELVLSSDWRSKLDAYSSDGRLKAYEGEAEVLITYVDGKTIATAAGTPSGPGLAKYPIPENTATGVETFEISLSWTKSETALYSDFYFSEDLQKISEANNLCPDVYKERLETNSYFLDELDYYTTYYWRIDQIDANGILTKGNIWQFTTVGQGNADLNNNGIINICDLGLWANKWLECSCLEPNWCEGADLTRSNGVDAFDFASFAKQYDFFGPWDREKFYETPETFAANDLLNEPDVTPLYYEVAKYKGKKTRVFGYYGKPEGSGPFPAMVLLHGGGGTARASWVRLWNSKGYAAISIDTNGSMPSGPWSQSTKHNWPGPPAWGNCFDQIDWPVEDQWPYHAVADIMLANSLLRSFPEIDPNRIGVHGGSWGGYLSCMAAGVDDRFAFAIPVYGCGYLNENSAWLDRFAAMGDANEVKWTNLWDPSSYLQNCDYPVLWVNGTNDYFFPLDSYRKSYKLVKGPIKLSIQVRMNHGQNPVENCDEVYAFADSICKDAIGLPEFSNKGINGSTAWAEFSSETSIDQAELVYTLDDGIWRERSWETKPASIDGNTVSATIPTSTTVYYFNITDSRGLISSSEHIEVLNE